jgi:hypothetical protein
MRSAAILLAAMATSCGGKTASEAAAGAQDAAAVEDSAPATSDAAREAETDAPTCVQCDPTADAAATLNAGELTSGGIGPCP